jgi:hypothetical protein
MSQDNNQAEFQLPEVDKAAEVLDSLYAEAFFAKMAEYGHVPQTESDAYAMLETAAQLDAVDNDPAVKQAQEQGSPYAVANDSLKAVLSPQAGSNAYQQEEAIGVKQAAYALAQDPSLYASVLAVKAAEAEALSEVESELLEGGEHVS